MSVSKIGSFGEAMLAQEVTPAQRLEATARRILNAQPERMRVPAFLAALGADNLALIELMRPLMHARAAEYLRSLAEAGEGEGHKGIAEQANPMAPSPNQSPQGGDVGQGCHAEQANRTAPTSQQSAQADGREGHCVGAEQASKGSPSRPISNLVPVTSHLRGKPGSAQPRPISIVTPRPSLAVEAITAARQSAAHGLLMTFKIGDTPLGESTPEMCRTFVKKRSRDAIFVTRVISGVPDGQRIAAHVTDDMAATAWREAMQEVYNV